MKEGKRSQDDFAHAQGILRILERERKRLMEQGEDLFDQILVNNKALAVRLLEETQYESDDG